MSATLSDLFSQMDAVIKQAEAKAAGQNDPDTSHPVGDAPDGTQSASTGSQASHLEKEVPANVGSEVSTNTAETATITTEQPKMEQGQNVTGPNEAPPEGKPKGHPDDPGTSHPASGDAGPKFSSLQSFDDVINASNSLLSVITASTKKATEKKANETSAETPKAPETPAATPTAPVEKSSEAQPAATAENKVEEPVKAAAPADNKATPNNAEFIGMIQKSAADAAAKFVDYMSGFIKACEDPMAAMAAAGGSPPMAAGGGGEAMPGMAMGGPPAAAPAGGVDPKAEALAVIQELMAQTGLTIEELNAALGGAGGAPGGGGEGGGEAEEASEPAAAEPKEASISPSILKGALEGLKHLAEIGNLVEKKANSKPAAK